MGTFALIHGGGGSAWDWRLVVPELRERGHEPVAVDLPCEDESAGWREYAEVVVSALGDRRNVVVVGLRSEASRLRSSQPRSVPTCWFSSRR